MFKRADFLLLGVALGLSLFGLAMIASVSVYQSYQLTTRFVTAGSWDVPSNAFYLWRSFCIYERNGHQWDHGNIRLDL